MDASNDLPRTGPKALRRLLVNQHLLPINGRTCCKKRSPEQWPPIGRQNRWPPGPKLDPPRARLLEQIAEMADNESDAERRQGELGLGRRRAEQPNRRLVESDQLASGRNSINSTRRAHLPARVEMSGTKVERASGSAPRPAWGDDKQLLARACCCCYINKPLKSYNATGGQSFSPSSLEPAGAQRLTLIDSSALLEPFCKSNNFISRRASQPVIRSAGRSVGRSASCLLLWFIVFRLFLLPAGRAESRWGAEWHFVVVLAGAS